ncbi:MAG: TonB family protein [Acidobacteriota bacterium]|nr:TonB family protein [Acidobacteriota bacterium]
MRRIQVASALLFPLLCTAAAVASSPATDAPASTSTLRVSTGVTPAEVIYAPSIALPQDETAQGFPNIAEIVVHMNVDETGKAQDIKVVRSLYPTLNEHVVDAVRQFRFRPARLDDQAVPVDMSLKIELQR